jgi:hypothetical protein
MAFEVQRAEVPFRPVPKTREGQLEPMMIIPATIHSSMLLCMKRFVWRVSVKSETQAEPERQTRSSWAGSGICNGGCILAGTLTTPNEEACQSMLMLWLWRGMFRVWYG